MVKIYENYLKILKNIEKTCNKIGRDISEITVIAVSKTFPVEVIKDAYDSGIKIFGENYAQELRDKSKYFIEYDISWHFIGRIQLNKLKYIVPVSDLIHSVSRVDELEKIDLLSKKLNKIQRVLIQVNVSGEETKSGLKPKELSDFVYKAKDFKNVQVIGLMTIAPFTDDERIIRNVFSRLRLLKEDLQKDFPEINHLSMGMSNDYLIAVEEGATILRIGTAIFGERKYK